MHSDHFLYTDRTIGFTVGTSLTLSTDRGATWRTHRLPDPGTLGLPRGSHIASARDDVIPTTSGALVLHYTLPGHQQPSVLARSTDRAWSSFARVGRSPHDGLVTAKGNVLWTCDRGRPDSRGACSYSDDLGATWRSTHLPH